jgi:hypothetical protein
MLHATFENFRIKDHIGKLGRCARNNGRKIGISFRVTKPHHISSSR